MSGIGGAFQGAKCAVFLPAAPAPSLGNPSYHGGLANPCIYPHSTETFQDDVVRPRLGLIPGGRITADVWNAFLEERPDIRERIEAQVPWRKEKVGIGLSHIYTVLCGIIHGFQIGEEEVTISRQLISAEECLAAAALLDERYVWHMDPPALKDKYAFNVERAREARQRAKKGKQ